MIRLAPSLLSANFACLSSDIEEVEKMGLDLLHLDIMDGHFVPNLTFGPGLIKDLRSITKMEFDVHLMVENPENYIPAFIDAGADYITVHAEGNHHLHRLLEGIREGGAKASLALNPGTPLSAIEWLLPQLDMILLMSVNPGFGGQQFIPQIVQKIKELKGLLDKENFKIPIQVDGGINQNTAPLVVEAGAEILVAGSAIFERGEIAANIRKLKASLDL